MPTLSTFLRLLTGRRACSSSSVRPEIKNMSRESSSRAAMAGRGKREQQCAAAQRSDQGKESAKSRPFGGIYRREQRRNSTEGRAHVLQFVGEIV